MTGFDTATKPRREFDGYGRYLLPDPDSGKETAWTRATTYAKSVSDTFAITQWEMRMVTAGIGMRRDLYALAAATPIDDKQTLNRIAKDAKEAAAASSGANLGTSLHAWTEAVDRGEHVTPPAPWDADINAYTKAMADAKIQPVAEWIERIVIVPELRIAGKFDRIVRLADGTLVIDDVKTGKDLSYAWNEIAIQLAIYANAPLMWDETTRRYEPMPDLDTNRAIVAHLPVGTGTCTLYQIDIAAGWQAARLCGDVRQWRTRKGLAAIYEEPLDRLRASVTAADLTKKIKAAECEADLIELYLKHQPSGDWTPTHTAAATRRKQDLYTTGV